MKLFLFFRIQSHCFYKSLHPDKDNREFFFLKYTMEQAGWTYMKDRCGKIDKDSIILLNFVGHSIQAKLNIYAAGHLLAT
ncbi:hypothetical protein CAEBREN_23817 [Caenorhabditis brenneri]|uniref:Uncharacterized protein n=1 Tax=Caenorhabditis brenneri TaxID=135651 RepID=G0P2S9_CAEBE|nr:hypothetical protein CAEBREN_23817 [Caenorhabditis brenneri]